MKKKLSALLLVSTLTISSVPVMAANTVNFNVDGLNQINAGTVINKDGYNLLGLREVFEMLGAEVSWNDVKRCATATKDGKTVLLYVDANKGYCDETEVSLPTGCTIINGRIFVPVRFVSDALGYEIEWNGEKQLITINTGSEKYIMLNTKPDVTKDTLVISYDEALKLAIDKNSSLKNIEDSVDYLDEMRDNLGDTLWALDRQSIQIDSNLFNLTQKTDELFAAQLALQTNVANTIETARGIKNIDIQRQMVSVNEEMVKDGVEIALKSCINSIKGSVSQIDLLEDSIALGKINIEQLELKNKLGYESDYNLQSAKTKQLENESNLEMLKLNLANQKQALKTLLGVDANQDIYVESDVKFDALKGVKLEQYVTNKRETDPSIKTLKNDVFLAEYKERTNAGYSSESKIGVRNELNTAKRKLSDSQDTLEKNIRTAYNNIKQLEEKNTTLLRAVEQAKSDYNSVVASYKSGLATELQVKQAKLAILSAEKNVEDNAMSYDMLTFTFNKPYLLASAK